MSEQQPIGTCTWKINFEGGTKLCGDLVYEHTGDLKFAKCKNHHQVWLAKKKNPPKQALPSNGMKPLPTLGMNIDVLDAIWKTSTGRQAFNMFCESKGMALVESTSVSNK